MSVPAVLLSIVVPVTVVVSPVPSFWMYRPPVSVVAVLLLIEPPVITFVPFCT